MELTVSQAGQDAAVQGSEMLLTRMVDNLIDNAVRHNQHEGLDTRSPRRPTARRPGWWSRPAAGCSTTARSANSPEPFRRLAPDRTGSDSGTGLGLSIVAAITATHHGTLDLHARAQGGLRAVVALPTAPDPR